MSEELCDGDDPRYVRGDDSVVRQVPVETSHEEDPEEIKSDLAILRSIQKFSEKPGTRLGRRFLRRNVPRLGDYETLREIAGKLEHGA
ncbi:MAG: hypothetical protein WBX25_05400 [Rhodomicrobium sp.]